MLSPLFAFFFICWDLVCQSKIGSTPDQQSDFTEIFWVIISSFTSKLIYITFRAINFNEVKERIKKLFVTDTFKHNMVKCFSVASRTQYTFACFTETMRTDSVSYGQGAASSLKKYFATFWISNTVQIG